jgi:hypothetical protein
VECCFCICVLCDVGRRVVLMDCVKICTASFVVVTVVTVEKSLH